MHLRPSYYDFHIVAVCIVLINIRNATCKNRDWRIIEKLAETHPYITALLNSSRNYICTGIIINDDTVLTSGYCITNDPQYIVVGAAILSNIYLGYNVLRIREKELHPDYIFESKKKIPNITAMHSNVGLVYSYGPVLQRFLEGANLKQYDTEVRRATLTVVGYGQLPDTGAIVLQKQTYLRMPCINPKWYYCICGYESASISQTYESEFGSGAPVFDGEDIVAVTAAPCGTLFTPLTMEKYNIFTGIGPYLSWIVKSEYFRSKYDNKAVVNENNWHQAIASICSRKPTTCINFVLVLCYKVLS